MWIIRFWRGLLGLLWPTQCAACGAPDEDCCADCLGELCRAQGRVRWGRTAAGVPVCVAGPYAGPPRALLLACKHGGRTGFARQLGALLRAPLRAAVSNAHGPSPPLLVAAPSRASRVRERGYRHVELIVRAAITAGDVRAVLLPRALRAARGRRSQVGLAPAERRRNAALVRVRRTARGRVRGREVVVVDDVVTTGATADAAVRVLEAAGARVVAVVALCAVERRAAPVRRAGAGGEVPGR